MSVRVSAVVISHNQPDWLRKTLKALNAQTRPVDEIIAVDSSDNEECAQVFAEFNISPVIRRKDPSFGALVSVGVAQAASIFTTPNLAGDSLAPIETSEEESQKESQKEGQHSWYWLLHDDSVALPDTLEKLLAAADLSPSVAMLGPKQVDPNRPKLIVQQGLTLTKLGGIFSLVDNELDQAQHDSTDDVLAIGTAGALIRNDLYRRLQGFDRHAPNLASDIDFSIRARLSGYRVVVVPSAHILHAGLSLKGERPRRWLQGSPQLALRRAEIHLQLAYLPVLLVWMYAVLLPVTGVLRALWRVATKNSSLVTVELSAAYWGFATIPVRLLSRAKVDLNRDISLRSLWPLRATFAMVRHRNRMLQDHVADEVVQPKTSSKHQVSKDASKAALQNQPIEIIESAIAITPFASRWFVVLLLVLSSWQFWPTSLAAVGGTLAPLNGSWVALASRAGASWQDSGFGVAAPSDPFNWLLAGIGALWFVTPSLALAALIFLARPLAFASAWFAFGLVTKRAWLRAVLALAYVLWPSILESQLQGRMGAILVWVLLPWLVFAISKIIGSGSGRQARGRLSTWVGVAGLLFASVSVSAPALAPVLFLTLAVVSAARVKRAIALLWVAALAFVLAAPYVWFMVAVLGQPLGALSEPGFAVDSNSQSFLQILLGSPNDAAAGGSIEFWLTLWPAVFGVIALIGLLSKRAFLASGFIALAVVAAGTGFVLQRIWFEPTGVHGSAAATTALSAVAILCAAGFGLDVVADRMGKASFAFVATSLVAGVIVSLSFSGINQTLAPVRSTQVTFADGRTVAAIVAAEAAQGSHLRVLKITQQNDSSFNATLIAPNGLLLESNSTAVKYVLAANSATDKKLLSLDALVANLVSANGTDLQQSFANANIGFVLVPEGGSADLNASLNSVAELEPVGQTEFGWLWRVHDAKDSLAVPVSWRQTWSITKVVQLAFIVIFLLLAIPGAPRRKAKNTGNIFVANDFEENEFDGDLASADEAEESETF